MTGAAAPVVFEAPWYQCPCGCGEAVHDSSGYFVGMARYAASAAEFLRRLEAVVAGESDLADAADAGDAGEGAPAEVSDDPVRRAVTDLREGTDALRELLIAWCHAPTPGMVWSSQVAGACLLWEHEFDGSIVTFERVDLDAYRVWLGESTPVRAMRHGGPWAGPYGAETTDDAARIIDLTSFDSDDDDIEVSQHFEPIAVRIRAAIRER